MMGLYLGLADAFLYSAYAVWEKEKDGKGGSFARGGITAVRIVGTIQTVYKYHISVFIIAGAKAQQFGSRILKDTRQEILPYSKTFQAGSEYLARRLRAIVTI